MKDIYSINNPMAPLWIKYPQINRYSLGWRMGFGESYVVKFGEWYESLNNEEKKEYKEMFPEPKGWLGWYEEVFDRDIYDEDVLLWDKDRNMKYSLENVQADFKKSKKNKFLFFWGHQLSRDGSITKTALSQWWKSDFVVDIDTYSCMEQYMMAEKARLFGDEEILEKIMNSKYPKQIKELGRKIKNFDEEIWTRNKYSIILNGNYAKFTQNEDLREFLIGTKNRILVEASPYDKVWGIGMSSDDINIENPLTWKGLNLLGFALMEVRDEIIKVYENYNKLK